MNSIHTLIGDARLLVVLDVLLQEGNATRAAARLGVTQSSVSHSLRRLRARLGDELLVRSGRTLLPTPRAVALRGPLHRLLGELGELMDADREFDPATSTRRLTIGASDLFTTSTMPALMRRMDHSAPSMQIAVRGPRPAMYEALERGDFDLAIANLPAPPRGFHRRVLFSDDFTCLARRDHPRLRRRPLTLARYVAERHVLVTPTGRPGSFLDERLEQIGERRDIALTLPHFSAAALVVAGSDLLTTLPTRVAGPLAKSLGLRRMAPPLSDLSYGLSAYWHDRVAHDPAVTWTLGQLTAVCAQNGPP